MKRLPALTLALVFSLSLAACGDNGGSASEAASEESGVPTPSVANLQSVKLPDVLPDGWSANEGSAAQQYQKGTATLTVADYPVSGATPQAYIDAALEQLGETRDDFKLDGEVEDITADSAPGKTFTFEYGPSNARMKMQYIYIFAGSKAYCLMFGDSAGNFSSLKPDIETILSGVTAE